MKKLIGLLLIIGMVLFIWGCNTPGGNIDDDGPAEDLELTFEGNGDGSGQLFAMQGDDSEEYPGLEVTLTGDIKDISKYSQVIIDATLYSDADGTTEAEPSTGEDSSLAQCKLLKIPGGSNWATESNNVCANDYTKYNMAIDGETIMDIPAGSSGIPTILLVQANWKKNPQAVRSIKVRTVKFVARTDQVVLIHVYPENDTTHMEVSGNQITWKTAMYSDCAALFAFPEDWGTGDDLSNQTIKFTYSIPDHECDTASAPPAGTDTEHQLHIQAAQNTSERNMFNGKNDQPGQKYITLDGLSGSFTVPANDLIAASKVNGDANDIKGPFTLDAVRIVNNGTVWTDDTPANSGTHYRCRSYVLVFESITIE